MDIEIEYKVNSPITADQFIDLLQRSTLGERRPVEDINCIEGMLKNSNLMISAWRQGNLVGIARSLTDFNYACYLSDLAVCRNYHDCGIGRKMQVLTQQQLGQKCKIILVAAPDANTYYEHIGYASNSRCWVLERDKSLE